MQFSSRYVSGDCSSLTDKENGIHEAQQPDLSVVKAHLSQMLRLSHMRKARVLVMHRTISSMTAQTNAIIYGAAVVIPSRSRLVFYYLGMEVRTQPGLRCIP